MVMSLKARITEDMKTAMRAKDAARLGAVRLLLAAIKQREVDERIELDDTQIIAVIDKMLKQRRDSITQFEAAGRQELADIEKFEMGVLQAYMPQAASAGEIDSLIIQAITSTGAAGIKDMGKVMAILKTQLAGRADMAQVSTHIKAKLAG
ncbi:transamidase GatB domain protein [Sulfuriferula multivorans]|uniref:Transamidase GatB domain protein n=2 Tax=Sulfuricellaceae TaxID=2772226 RepID=A0A401JH61_9PROT|nr:transamidase GatB domain protein [Sulfuriferula multivorans]